MNQTESVANGTAGLIGVFGGQGAGKTVFLTCIYQSLELALPRSFRFRLDRKSTGGASYFEAIERNIRTTGQTAGTNTSLGARFDIEVTDDSVDAAFVPIYLRDFPGGHFEAYSDLAARERDEVPEERLEELREVSSWVEEVDAVILLLSARTLGDSKEIPFSRSAVDLIERCHQTRTPISVVVTQAELRPDFDYNKFLNSPRIQRFRNLFSDDLDAAESDTGPPFGRVTQLTCYQLDSAGNIIVQEGDGSIWLPEGPLLFIDMLRAAWPRVRARLKARQTAEQQARLAVTRETLEERKRQKSRSRAFSLLMAFTLLAVLAAAGLGFYYFLEQNRSKDLDFVRRQASAIESGDIATVTPEDLKELQRIRRDQAEKPSGDSDLEAERALERLESSTFQAADAVFLDPEGNPLAKLRKLEELSALLPASGDLRDSWNQNVAPRLERRIEFLESLNALTRPDSASDDAQQRYLADKLDLIDQSLAALPPSTDSEWRTYLESLSESEQGVFNTLWGTEIGRQSTVEARMVQIRARLAELDEIGNSERAAQARRYLAEAIIRALYETSRAEDIAVPALRVIVKELEEQPTAPVHLKSIVDRASHVDTSAEAKSRLKQFETALAQSLTEIPPYSFAVESAFRDLFYGLPASQMTDLWSSMAAVGLEESIFEQRRSYWPHGLKSLPHRIENLASATEAFPYSVHDSLLERLQNEHLYYEELQYLHELLWLRDVAFRFRERASDYHNKLTGYNPGRDIRTGTLEDLQTEIEKMQEVDPETPLVSKFNTLRQIVERSDDLVELYDDSFFGAPYVASKLSELARSACRDILEAQTGDCAEDLGP